MKILIFAVAALMIVGGGGAGAYFYFGNQAVAAGTDGEDAKKHAEKMEKKKSETFEFVELAPLILPIIDENGVSQVVSIVITIEVADTKNADKVKKMTPRLTDAYLQDLYGMLNKHAALKGGVIQISAIKARLNKVSEKVVGEGVVQDVLLQVVQQRPV